MAKLFAKDNIFVTCRLPIPEQNIFTRERPYLLLTHNDIHELFPYPVFLSTHLLLLSLALRDPISEHRKNL